MVNPLYEMWQKKNHDGVYLIGAEEDGCGVMYDDGWTGNVCTGNQVQGVGPYPTREEAQEACIELWHRTRKEAGYEPFETLPTQETKA